MGSRSVIVVCSECKRIFASGYEEAKSVFIVSLEHCIKPVRRFAGPLGKQLCGLTYRRLAPTDVLLIVVDIIHEVEAHNMRDNVQCSRQVAGACGTRCHVLESIRLTYRS